MLAKEKRNACSDYFFDLINMMDLFTYFFNSTLIITTMLRYEILSLENRCIVCSILAIVMWVKMLDWLRMFDSTTFFIKLIIQTLVDVSPFFVILFIFMFMFGSALYIIGLNREED